MYPYIDIPFIEIQLPTYSLFLSIGIITAFLLLDKLLIQQTEKFKDDVFILIAIAIPIGFILAIKINQFFYNGYISLGIDNFNKMSVLPGFLGASIFITLMLYIKKHNPLYVFNLICPCVAIAHAFGRIGCFMGGCCYGIPTSCMTGVVFPDESPASQHYGGDTYIHPVQLYSSIVLFLISLLLLKCVRLEYRLGFYLISYGIGRFIIEFFRGDIRSRLSVFEQISPSRLISLFMITIGIILLYKEKPRKSLLYC